MCAERALYACRRRHPWCSMGSLASSLRKTWRVRRDGMVARRRMWWPCCFCSVDMEINPICVMSPAILSEQFPLPFRQCRCEEGKRRASLVLGLRGASGHPRISFLRWRQLPPSSIPPHTAMSLELSFRRLAIQSKSICHSCQRTLFTSTRPRLEQNRASDALDSKNS